MPLRFGMSLRRLFSGAGWGNAHCSKALDAQDSAARPPSTAKKALQSTRTASIGGEIPSWSERIMRVGVPKEIKNHEYRVGLTPASVGELVAAGHEVFVETKAGTGIDFPDSAYEKVGATIL